MAIQKKVSTAFTILKQKGPQGVMKTIRQKLAARRNPDEAAIIFEILSSRATPGTMVDVGAHHGYSLLPFAQAGWQIFAFEPDPENRTVLQKTADLYPNISIDPRAVSDKEVAAAPFFTSQESDGIGGLSAFLPSHETSFTVETTTLGSYFEEKDLKELHFLKIDTEGFDLMVLQGLPWDKVQPQVILCEFEDAKTQKLGYSFETMAEFLVEHGYRVIISEWLPIVRYGEAHRWLGFATYPHTLHDEKAWGNLIATNDDEIYQKLLNQCKLVNKT